MIEFLTLYKPTRYIPRPKYHIVHMVTSRSGSRIGSGIVPTGISFSNKTHTHRSFTGRRVRAMARVRGYNFRDKESCNDLYSNTDADSNRRVLVVFRWIFVVIQRPCSNITTSSTSSTSSTTANRRIIKVIIRRYICV